MKKINIATVIASKDNTNREEPNAKDILRQILIREQLNIKTFAEMVGIPASQLYDIKKGKTKNISSRMAEKITKTIPTYNKAWLLTGEGKMTKDIVEVESEISDIDNEDLYTITKEGKESFEELVLSMRNAVQAIGKKDDMIYHLTMDIGRLNSIIDELRVTCKDREETIKKKDETISKMVERLEKYMIPIRES